MSKTDTTDQTMLHLGDVLSLLADLHPDEECQAITDAKNFYNAHNPDNRIEPTDYPGHLYLVRKGGPLDAN